MSELVTSEEGRQGRRQKSPKLNSLLEARQRGEKSARQKSPPNRTTRSTASATSDREPRTGDHHEFRPGGHKNTLCQKPSQFSLKVKKRGGSMRQAVRKRRGGVRGRVQRRVH